jgi:anhydro-N-acetylmuramic acid kinase
MKKRSDGSSQKSVIRIPDSPGKSLRIIGVNSGTSCDGLDFALVEFNSRQLPRLLYAKTYPYAVKLRSSLLTAGEPEFTDGVRWMELDAELGQTIGMKANSFITELIPRKSRPDYIASHGHTIRHLPGKRGSSLSLQIGNPARISAKTGIPVISNFRNTDIAAGGEGAPLSPVLHQVLFKDKAKFRAVINIGGIANITVLPPGRSNSKPFAADCGPGNMAVDPGMEIIYKKGYDRGGTTALKGRADRQLVEKVLDSEFFRSPAPRSTGREQFGLKFVHQIIENLANRPPEDIIASLSEITVCAISDFISRFAPGIEEIYLCGGGAKNRYFIERLKKIFPEKTIALTSDLGYDPDYLEAVLWAYLGYCFINGIRIDSGRWTGARKTYVPGELCLP